MEIEGEEGVTFSDKPNWALLLLCSRDTDINKLNIFFSKFDKCYEK